MKIISWNMGCGFDTGGYSKHHDVALGWLRAQEPDVALLQEVQFARFASWKGMRVHSVPTSPGRSSGNAVAVRADRLEPIGVVIEGALVAGARARVTGDDFILVSAHVLTGERQEQALANFASKVSGMVAGSRFVVGGDFNASLHWPKYGTWFFDPMRAAGFEDTRPQPQEVQSYWGRGSMSIIQDDHVFVDRVTKAAVARGSWAILSGDDHRRWSDHGPVVVEALD